MRYPAPVMFVGTVDDLRQVPPIALPTGAARSAGSTWLCPAVAYRTTWAAPADAMLMDGPDWLR